MSGVRLDIAGHDETLRALKDAAGRAGNARGMWDNIGASLVVSTQARFERGEGPDGFAWSPSIRALVEGGKTLVDSARLVQSMTHNAGDKGVEVGTNVLYAATHQFGATIRPKGDGYLMFKIGEQWVSTKEVTIVPRPFLGLDDDDGKEILAIAGEWIAGPEAAGSPA